jgi:two-component system, OmpR family, heavy metal sensor histidine kinase CusS
MFSVQGIKELASTLRFRIVMWITLVVFVMVFAANTGVREIGQRAIRMGYDEFLARMVEEIANAVEKHAAAEKEKLLAVLKDKVKENEYLFVQVYDGRGNLIWGSNNAGLHDTPPTFETEFNGPYDSRRHRVYEKLLHTEADETFYIRCGFLHLELTDDIELINRNIFMVSAILVILAPLGGYVIAWRATRPISHVIETAAQLEPGNLKERLPIRGTGDEIDQLSHTINGMLDRLASYINQNRDFLANAAHELRSPLAAIRSSVEVGMNQCRAPEEYIAILADVMEEIAQLTGLVNRLLILAEADAAGLGARNQSARLEKLVHEAVLMFDAVAEARGVRLTYGKLEPALVRGDETSLRQIVRNLIDNAIKYNRAAGAVVVDLRVDASANCAILTVRDTGIGIDKDALPRIFERFYRVDKARSREQERGGYGLGLSICKSIILALHGDIKVESEKGKGTTFTVRLPLADEAAVSSSGDRLGLSAKQAASSPV